MNQERKMPVPGEFYRHFKNRMYQIVTIAIHSETGEKMVVYQALYGDFKVWARPLSMFMEEVDHEKYPDAKQKYRFERVEAAGAGSGRPGGNAGESAGATVTSSSEDSADSDTGDERPMSPHLLAFFDAMDVKNYDKMLEALAGLSKSATRKEIDDICMVLDIRPSGGAIVDEIGAIRRHVLMLKKFDGERLR